MLRIQSNIISKTLRAANKNFPHINLDFFFKPREIIAMSVFKRFAIITLAFFIRFQIALPTKLVRG